jgi:hypothetical protein
MPKLLKPNGETEQINMDEMCWERVEDLLNTDHGIDYADFDDGGRMYVHGECFHIDLPYNGTASAMLGQKTNHECRFFAKTSVAWDCVYNIWGSGIRGNAIVFSKEEHSLM